MNGDVVITLTVHNTCLSESEWLAAVRESLPKTFTPRDVASLRATTEAPSGGGELRIPYRRSTTTVPYDPQSPDGT